MTVQKVKVQMGLWIKADGGFIRVPPETGDKFSLEELQKYVGGYIQIIDTMVPDRQMIVNEDGKLLQLPVNPVATFLRETGLIDPIVGDVLIVHDGEI